jgi:hypothetical protein
MFSDHSNLLYFKTAKYLSPKQARWALFIDNFNMLIYHVSGKKNPADGPSRREDFVGKVTTLPEARAILDRLVQPAELDELQTDSPATFHGIHDLSFQRPNRALLDHFAKNYLEQLHRGW